MAHGGRGGAGPGCPLAPVDRLRDPARDQAQPRQRSGGRGACGRVPDPVVGLPRLHQPGLGGGGPAGEEIQRAQQPAAPRTRPGGLRADGQGLRLCHLAAGDQDLHRVQHAPVGRRGLAADGRRLRQPGRRLRRPAVAPGVPAGRLQLGGQPVVRAYRRGHPVAQRPVPVHQARRPLVQPAAPGRAQVRIDGPLHQQVAEPDPGRGPARLLGQDSRRDRLPQGRHRIGEVRQRGRRGQPAAVAQHRRRPGQLPGRRAQRTHPQQHHPSQRPRHPERPAVQAQAPGPMLFQHRPAIQRIAAGFLQQTADGSARQIARPQRPAQRHHLRGPQPTQADPAGPVVPGQETQPALPQPGQLPRAARHHHQHRIGPQAAQREQQRPRRRSIRPLHVIDARQHHRPAVADLTQPHHQVRAHRQRIHPVAQLRGQQSRRAAARTPGAGQQLTHHPVRQQQLRLIATGAQHRRVGQPRREPRQQARLADARLPLNQHHPGLARAGRRRGRLQPGQLIRPANEHPPTPRRPAPDRLVHPHRDRIPLAGRPPGPR